HRCSSFFCWLTMSVRCTVAGLEQNWHFTPGPFLSSGRPELPRPGSTLFEPADPVPEAGRLLVRFPVDRAQELLAELDQVRLRLLGVRRPPRGLADVPGLAVDVLQQRGQLLAELLVVVRAAQPPRVAEVHELDAADLALAVHHGRLVGFLAAGRGGEGLAGL